MFHTYITIALGLLNLLGVLCGLILVRRHFRLVRTSSYIERYNTEDMAASKIAVKRLERKLSECSPEECSEFLREFNEEEEHEEEVEKVDRLINLLTELGVAYKLGIIDKRAITIFDAIVPGRWKGLEPHIKYCQERANKQGLKVWEHFEYLKNEIEKGETGCFLIAKLKHWAKETKNGSANYLT